MANIPLPRKSLKALTKFFILPCLMLASFGSWGQFAPQAGLAGSTAIHKDSTIIQSWGNQCSITRGWLDIADTTLGKSSFGDSSKALGVADGDMVSLGDGGSAIYYFNEAIQDHAGYDFAVFENGFMNPTDSNQAYLELAKVSVSTDGIHYATFKSISNLDTSIQIGGFGDYSDCRSIHNLAGKYIGNFGTPFDLAELINEPFIDISSIRYIKITDVIGTINQTEACRDSNNHPINDPYPTPFPTCGFDLDALALLKPPAPTSMTNQAIQVCKLFPVPFADQLNIQAKDIETVHILNMYGQTLFFQRQTEKINTSNWPNGIYFIELTFSNGSVITQKISK
ncbi:MAG: T9SS type A sorting domain-containing protein [Chitinophagaceae bacterium]|nr:T9SS type A sorting domain-containing protein [Chitinophagaceae bacterium]